MREIQIISFLVVATLVWNMYALAFNFFRTAWATSRLPVTGLAYTFNVLLVIFLPLVSASKLGLVGMTISGGLMFFWSLSGVILQPKTKYLRPLPGILGPLLPTITGFLIAYLGLRILI